MPTRAGRIVLDMDSSESPVHGAQEGSAYNGHFESVCYHPLFLFTEHGGCVAATLRPGNVHSADDWDDLLVPEIERQQAAGTRVAFRADAAFAQPEIYEALEQRDVDYAIRMPANKSLELDIEDILFRPPGRPSRTPVVRYKSFRYQAKSWTTPRRIVAKVEHHRGELFPRVGFIVTHMTLPSRSVVRFYTKRGTAEQWIKEGKQATHWTRLSCHRFRANEVRLQLSVLAYNLGNLWRGLVLPPRVKRWSLTSLQQRLVKTGGRLVKHARYYWSETHSCADHALSAVESGPSRMVPLRDRCSFGRFPWLISQALSVTYMAGERRLYLERNCRLPESPAHSRRRNREGPASSKGLNSQRGFGPAVEPRRKSRPRSTSLHGSSPCKCQRLSTLRWDRLPPSRPSTKSGARAGGRRLSDRRLHRWLAGTSASAPSSHGAADLLGLNRAHICVRNLTNNAG